MKNRIFALLAAVATAISLTACGSSESQTEKTTHTDTSVQTAATAAPPETTVPAATVLESSGTLGVYSVQINGFELAKDYSGSPAILVSFTFTNNSEENTSAIVALNYDAFQNGIELDTAIIMDSSLYNANDSMKDLQPGASIDVKAAYLLTSETAPVEFEISETFSLTDAKLGKTFEISEGGTTELSVAPSGDPSGSLGDYYVSIVSQQIVADYQGAKAILLELGFTNNSKDTTSFISHISCQAFQDGVELETAYLMDVDTGTSQMCNVKPGAGRTVTVAYVLSSDTSPVEIEIEEYFSFSGEKLEATFNIA